MSSVLSELRVMARSFLVLVRHPFTLVYPVVLSAVAVAMTAAILGYAFAAFSGAVYGNVVTIGIALLAYFFLLPFVIEFLLVAYSHEIHRLYQGERPLPGEGFGVAARKVGTIALATAIISLMFNGRYFAQRHPQFGRWATSITDASSQVLATFVHPAIAVQDGGAREIVDRISEAVQNRWGGALVTSVGVRTVGGWIAFLGIVTGVGLVAGHWFDLLPFEATAREIALLAGGAAGGGFFLGILLTVTVIGPVSTALYLYATEERVPEMLALEPDDLTR